MNYEIDISNQQQALAFDSQALVSAVERALQIEQVRTAVISISIVDNCTIHAVNRDHLQHDYPTDVISFQLEFRDLSSEPDSDLDSPISGFETEFCADDAFDADEPEHDEHDEHEPEDEFGSDEEFADFEPEGDIESVGCLSDFQSARDENIAANLKESTLNPADPNSLRARGALIEGEIIASAEMAVQMTADENLDAFAELTLYVIHGLLHICGYDDLTPDEQTIMRSREAAIMQSLGLTTRAH